MADLNELKPVGKLNPFAKFCCTIGNLPTSYMISLTYEEQLLWLCKYLEDTVIPAVNTNAEAVQELQELYVQLKEYVDNYFSDLNLQNEINNKLDEMAEDGTLAEIINEEIFEELNDKINNAMLKTDIQSYDNLTLERILRKFIKNSNSPSFSDDDFPTLQGGCYTGNDKMVLCQNKSDTNNRLIEISLLDGSIIRQTSLNLGHGNSIAYNNELNKLYIAGLTNTEKHSIFIIDYTSLTLENTLLFNELPENERIHSLSYDIITNKMYMMTETQPTNYITLYELNLDNNSLEKIDLEDYDNTLSVTFTNDMLVYNNIIYIMKYNPQLIICYNLITKELQNLYNIDNTISLGTPVGELQNISLMYDKPYKDILISSNRIECVNGYFNMFQFYKANPVYNVKKPVLLNNNLQNFIYVNINSSSNNPDGTTSKPFKHISEAIEICNNMTNATLRITEGTYPYSCIYGIKGKIQGGGTNINIEGLNIYLCNDIYLYGITVNNTNSLQDYDIYIESSKARFSNVNLSVTENANFDIHNSTIELNNVSNVKFNSRAENNIICYDTTPNYIVVSGNIPNMNKPVKLCNGNISNTSDNTTYDISNNPILYNTPNIKVMVHANYGYEYIELPNRLDVGTRLFSITVNNWIMTLKLTRTASTIAFNITSCKNITGNNVVDNTASATGDFILYAKN